MRTQTPGSVITRLLVAAIVGVALNMLGAAADEVDVTVSVDAGGYCKQSVAGADQPWVPVKVGDTVKWSSSKGNIVVVFPVGPDPEHPGTPFKEGAQPVRTYPKPTAPPAPPTPPSPSTTSGPAQLTDSEQSPYQFKYKSLFAGAACKLPADEKMGLEVTAPPSN